jgi:hypothetical protein
MEASAILCVSDDFRLWHWLWDLAFDILYACTVDKSHMPKSFSVVESRDATTHERIGKELIKFNSADTHGRRHGDQVSSTGMRVSIQGAISIQLAQLYNWTEQITSG